MSGWEVKRLGDLLLKTATVDPTKSPDKSFTYIDVSSVSNVSFAVEGTQELFGKDAPSRARRHVAAGDVIFATVRPTLQRVAIIPEHLDGAVCSTGYFVLRAGPKLDRTYLFHWLFSDKFRSEIEKRQRGASYPAVTDGDIRDQLILLPPLEDQRRIVAVLDEAFAAIATATANAEKNLANSQNWFATELSRCFAEVARQQPLGSFATLVRGPFGGSLKKNIFIAEGFAVYEQQHAIYDQFDDVRYYVNEEKFREMTRFEVHPGELIMSCSGTIGRVALVPDHARPGIINQALLKIVPSNLCLGEYLLWFMRSAAFRAKIADHSGGAALQNVASVAVLKNIEVPLPDLTEQEARVKKVHQLVDATEALTRLNKRKLECLAELKQSLLHRAFSGDLTERETLAA